MRFFRCHFWVSSLALIACGPGELDGGTTPDLAEVESASSADAEVTTDVTGSESGSGDTDPATSTTFVPPGPDFAYDACDVFMQDCPEGEKCVPFSTSGGNWDAFKCVPVLGEQGVGAACTYTNTADALDDCDADGHCWNVDEQGAGSCHAFCLGSADDPECPPGSACLISGSGFPSLCIPGCDPLEQDCGEGQGCYWASGGFWCINTTRGLPPGAGCGFVNDCAVGHYCTPSEVLPACEGSASCCAPFCELGGVEDTCAVLPGTSCLPFFEQGQAPPDLEDVGVCII